MQFLSFIPCGLPAQNRLVYRPVYPQVVPPTPSGEDTHDGVDEEFRKRDEKIRRDRESLRDQLRDVVFGVTRKPPPLEASPKELASIARKSESFDYRGTLQEIARIEEASRLLARERSERETQRLQDSFVAGRKRLRRQEEEALLLLLLN